jgi:hypothetical protein
MSAEKLAEALRLMLRQFTKTPSTLKDTQARAEAHRALADHEAEAKAAPANVIDAVLATTAAIHEAGAMEEIAKYRRLTDVVSEPVAWRWPVPKLRGVEWRYAATKTRPDSRPLYAAPVNPSPTPAPLTDEQIKRMKPVCADFVSFRAGVRAMEAMQANGGKA